MILYGAPVRDSISDGLAERLVRFSTKPMLVVISVGASPESLIYIAQKEKFGRALGVPVCHEACPSDISQEELLSVIGRYNTDSSVTGIIVQMPLPAHLDRRIVADSIHPDKDVDGLGAVQMGRLAAGSTLSFPPATARGIISLLDYYKVPLSGARVVVVGRSDLVGKPAASLCLSRDATVTVCHSHTKNLAEITRTADILIVACGKPKLIGESNIRDGQVVVDVGIHRRDGGLCGDVDFSAVKDKVGMITPVPGGVGPLTVASLFQNLCDAHEMRQKRS